MEEDCASKIDQNQNAQVLPPVRRPRVREVSSRFMSPVVPSELRYHNAKSPLPKLENKSHTPTAAEVQSRQGSTSLRRRRLELEVDPLRRSDENRLSNALETLETPFSIRGVGSQSKSNAISNSISITNPQRKQHDFKTSKENGGGRDDLHRIANASFSRSTKNFARADTPLSGVGWTMASASRSRILQQRLGNGTVTDATKLLQSSLPAPSNVPLSQETTSNSADPDENQESEYNARSVPDIRSSMPETDMLPTVSARLADKYCNRNIMSAESDSFQLSATRSLNLPLSSCDSSLFSLTSGLSRSHSNSINMGSLRLPPAPPCAKLGTTDTRKGRKASVNQEDMHSLRMLHNRYLQWRYANAKAEASLLSQRRETEKTFHSVEVAISEKYDSLMKKKRELSLLQRNKTLSAILDSQIPLLEAWPALEKDYTQSLSEASNALSNTSLRLPISGNVKADSREVVDALNSAGKEMEKILFHLQSFLTRAEETEKYISELAKVSSGERVAIDRCEELLSKAYGLQVEECSLKGHLIQLNLLQI